MNTFTSALTVRHKRILTTMLFVMLLVLSLFGLTRLLEDKISYREKGDFFAADGNFDVVFFGVSHMQNGILPMEIWQEYKISSYNWGYSNSTPAQNYYLLREVVRKNTPKLVVLDISGLVEYENLGNGKYRRDSIMSSHVVFDRFPFSIDKVRAVYDLFDDYDDRIDFLWDFIIYHNRWASLTKEDLGDINLNPERGAKSLTGISHAAMDLIPQDETIEGIEDYTCYRYFVKTLEFCESRHIPVLVVCLPHIMDETSMRVSNTVGDTVARYEGCEYYNMLYEGLLAYSIDTNTDNGHVNYAGACKTSSRLGEYLINHYELPDHSDDPYWQSDYAEYLDFRRSAISKQDTLVSYLMLLKNPGLSVDIEFYDENLWYSQTIASEVYFGGLEPVTTQAPYDYINCCAHTVLYASDGQVYDEAYWVYDDASDAGSSATPDIGDSIVKYVIE